MEIIRPSPEPQISKYDPSVIKNQGVAEFTFTEPEKISNDSKSIAGPLTRLIASFLTLGLSENVNSKIKKTLVPILGSILTQGQIKEKRQEGLNDFKKGYPVQYKKSQNIKVNVGDKVKLDGMVIKPKVQADGEAKYVIWLNGLGESYEPKLCRAADYANEVNANILVFNYRGCGDSSSALAPPTPNDFVTDTMAMVAYLKSTGIKAEDITIHGYSLGGGIGANALEPGMKYINDRSFSTFSKATKDMLPLMVKNIVTELAGPAIGALAGKTIGKALGFIASKLIKGYGLDLNTGKIYQKALIENSLIFYHKDDEIIQKSSLSRHLSKHKIVDLNDSRISNHKIVDFSKLNNASDPIGNAHVEPFLNFTGAATKIKNFINNNPIDHLPPKELTTSESGVTTEEVKFDVNLDFGSEINDNSFLNFGPFFKSETTNKNSLKPKIESGDEII